MISNQLIVCLGTTTLALSLFSAQGAGKTAVDLSKLPPASDKTGVTYATDIKPIFDKACITCHGAEKHKARLRLDGLEDVLKGGEDGRVVLPGNSAGSLLVHNIAFAGRKDHMPIRPGKAVPLNVTVGVDGATVGQAALTQPDAVFELNFPVPPEAVGKPKIEVAIEVDRTFVAPSNPRELGLVFGSIAVR